jgi:hypothetical protein
MKNCKKYLIADALLNYSKNSTTEFIETSKDSELSKLAEEKGIILPSPDLMLFRTIYAKIGEPNRNGVVINKEPVEKSLKTLNSKQINLEHEGKNFVCGHVIDAKLENEYIVIYGVFYKSLFQEEYETLKELFKDKKVYVSFEIWSKNPETGKSVIHDLEDGTREINPVLFHGVGLLMQHLPACKEAVLDKILGQKELENGEQIINKVFNEDLIYASFDYEESNCMRCKTCTCEKEVKIVEEIKIEKILDNDYDGGEIEEAAKLTTEQRNALPDSDFALIQEKDGKKIRRFPINDEAHVRNALARLPQAKDISEEEKKSALNKILKRAKELNMDELLKKYEKSSEETQAEVKPEETKTEEKSEVAETKSEKTKAEETKEEVIVEEATIVTTTQEVTKVDEMNPDGEVITTEVKTETIVVDDAGKEKQKIVEEIKTVVTYTYEQVQEEVKTAQEEIVAAMPKEVSDRIKELVKDGKSMKEAMKQAWDEYKKSQEKALEEKDTEIKNKNTELEQKTQEIADLKNPKVDAKKEKEMTVGSVITETKSELKIQAEKINEIIANKGKQ